MKNLALVFLIICSFLSFFAQSSFSQSEYVNYSERNKIEKYVDHFNVNLGYYQNSSLNLVVGYGGGCTEHEFYYTIKPEMLSDTLLVYLYHNANDDVCQALIDENLSIDLSVYKDFSKVKFVKILNPETDFVIATYQVINLKKNKT
jgi:hypothetical protein